MSDLSGRTGLIVGVANKRSLAWAIAQRADDAGARLVLTYQNDRLKENVDELVTQLKTPAVLLPCDVSRDDDIAHLFESLDAQVDGLDFVVHGAAFAPRESLSAPFLQTSREAFRIALDISAYSLVAVARGAEPLLARKGGGSIVTLSYLGSDRVFPNYNVMGVAKAALESSVRYLAADLGAQNIRVNTISAGPVKTLAASGISGFSGILQVYRDRAALKRNIDSGDVAGAAMFLLSDWGRGVTGEVIYVDAGYRPMGM
ncbi:Enoyl-[acyl-carrier-protein] reductase [NADH] FabI [Luteitalea pratensis]|uniref:Enoyl-[acyl-carrier-protein] reductase [NADH] n=1 Tax=Luteitalea pratensis TaxID=1855912 RepID=A0A143PH40_LUTPR|nr:enoyl-ACP reductase [Luteitalea pratensis]AMY07563.1 Enoyl-[acyl-carrier-protein] reductase [NADH] FabI [Luteitalea pratensis]